MGNLAELLGPKINSIYHANQPNNKKIS